MDIIELANLNAFYGNKKVLNNINMKIKKNKITAIIGPSGCGKSTLLAVLNRMIEENGGSIEGKVIFNEKDILSYSKNELRRKVGIVFQKPSPFPLSIYGNLAYAPLYYGVKDKKLLNDIVENKLKISGLYE
ncbi:MAG: ATP-binding cassette domain-containing protein, partial [Natronincolaceae bacterium]